MTRRRFDHAAGSSRRIKGRYVWPRGPGSAITDRLVGRVPFNLPYPLYLWGPGDELPVGRRDGVHDIFQFQLPGPGSH